MDRLSADPTLGNIIAGTLLISLFCAMASFVPVLGFAFFFMLPLTVLVYRVRFGTGSTLLVTALSLMVITLLSGGVNSDIVLITGMLAQGFLLGKFVENYTPVDRAIAYSTITILAVGAALVIIAGNLHGTGASSLLSEYIGKNLEMTTAIYKQLDSSEENIRALEESIGKIQHAMLIILPALTAAILVITAWINLLFGSAILKKAGFRTAAFDNLNLWKAPDNLVWGVIACALLLVLPLYAPRVAALNALIVMLTVYLLQGFAIISFYFEKKEVPLVIRVIVYGAVLVQQVLLLFIIGLGFFDTWLNLRRINATKTHIGG